MRPRSAARRALLATVGTLTASLATLGPAQGQTQLALVVPASEADSLVRRIEVARARIDWPYGPVVVWSVSSDGQLTDCIPAVPPGGVTAPQCPLPVAEPDRAASAGLILVPLYDPTFQQDADFIARVRALARALANGVGPSAADSGTQPARVEVADAVDARASAHAIANEVEIAGLARLAQLWTDGGAAGAPRVAPLERITVTATRMERRVFTAPMPVTVMRSGALEDRAAHSVADALRDVRGLDVEGVGPSQHRPVIRGLRGQRIVLLEDGIRWNNPRRRVESGEPTSLVGLGSVERVEILRGPASVLYGSDAIGGVVNVLTTGAFDAASDMGAQAMARWGSAGAERRFEAQAWGRADRFALRIGAGFREADPFQAPAGEFGDVVLHDDTRVEDSGVQDWSARIEAGWESESGQMAFLRHEYYDAEDAGFGLLDPAALGSESTVRLRTPEQSVDRTTLGWRATWPGSALAERLTVTLYRQSNERTFLTEVHSPFPAPPGAAIDIATRSDTDLSSLGTRVEASARLPTGGRLTYGLDAFRERSSNNDTSTSIVTGLGPPRVTGRSGSRVPNARLEQVGLFAQVEHDLTDRLSLIPGVRYQLVRGRAFDTPGHDGTARGTSDQAIVAALNALVRATAGLVLTGSVSRGFRPPNLIERFYEGPAPEASAYWLQNPELAPETSVNLELGARVERGWLWGEVFVFRNIVYNGITLEATGDSIDERIVFHNVNVEKLRFRGLELAAGARLPNDLSITVDHGILDVDDLRDAQRIFAESYPSKTTATARWGPAQSRVWAEYAVRVNGGSDGPVAGAGPVGERVPGFTVQDARAGIRIGTHRFTVNLSNVGDVLYAESLNVGAFRPEPGRAITLIWSAVF